MVRSFKVQSLSGNAQPLFGDVLTAALVIPNNFTSPIIAKVADTSIWAVGDRIVLDPGQADADVILVDRIVDGTTLWCQSEGDRKLNPHPNGTIIALSAAFSDIWVQAVAGGANPIWIAADSTVTSAGGGKVIYQVTDSRPPFHASPGAPYNVVRTTDYWMAAIAATQAIVGANQV